MSRLLYSLLFMVSALWGASETLRYSVNWASGLSLGEASLTADNVDGNSAARRRFEFRLEASVPGFAVVDVVNALSSGAFCAEKLEKNLKHGARLASEVSTFDQENRTLERRTGKGGKSTVAIGDCPKDALTFIYFLRQELAAGRIPAPQEIYFGAAYRVELKYAGVANVAAASGQEPADKFLVSIQGPASKNSLELFLGKDAARTPLLFRVPLPLGAFSMELLR